MRLFNLLAVGGLLSASLVASSFAATEPEVRVGGSAFVLVDTTEGAKEPLKLASVVPLVPGQVFGWIMEVDTTKDVVHWREEFSLPEAPASWGGEAEGHYILSADRRVATSERATAPTKGMIFNTWTIAAGDPPGHYRIRVFVEGELVKTFDFDAQ